MRTLSAIICFIAFFAIQYGKLVSYWQCRLITTISSTAACDCIKQLLDVPKDGGTQTTSTVKEKNEEIFLFHEEQPLWQLPVIPVTYATACIEPMPETHYGSVFQPPRL